MMRIVASNSKILKPTTKYIAQKVSNFHFSGRNENTLIFGGVGAIVGAVGIQYVLKAYRSLPKSDPEQKPIEGSVESGEQTTTKTQQASGKAKTDAGSSTSVFSSWFARNYYEGGFEDKMTKREAALVLGVRESATSDRIKEAHRRILLLNHPDRGGSAYVAAKINEAKDLLIKGKE